MDFATYFHWICWRGAYITRKKEHQKPPQAPRPHPHRVFPLQQVRVIFSLASLLSCITPTLQRVLALTSVIMPHLTSLEEPGNLPLEKGSGHGSSLPSQPFHTRHVPSIETVQSTWMRRSTCALRPEMFFGCNYVEELCFSVESCKHPGEQCTNTTVSKTRV